jgi:hypothetical protein
MKSTTTAPRVQRLVERIQQRPAGRGTVASILVLFLLAISVPAGAGGIPAEGLTILVTPWLNGVIPIAFTPDVTASHRDMVYAACAAWGADADVTCVEKTDHLAYLLVTSAVQICSAPHGAPPYGGAVVLNLGSAGCWLTRTVNHEFGHVLGLRHEHQRDDRDAYVEVFIDDVPGSLRSQFAMDPTWHDPGPYDFLSVMHYRDYTAATLGHGPTVQPRPMYAEFTNRLGEADWPTDLDRQSVRAIYGPKSDERPYLRFLTVGQPVTVTWSFSRSVTHWTLSAGTRPGASNLLHDVPMGQARVATGMLPVGVEVYIRVAGDGFQSNEVHATVPAVPEIRYVDVTGRTVDIGFVTPTGSGMLRVFSWTINELLALPISGGRFQASGFPAGSYLITIDYSGQWATPFVVTVP